MAEQIENPVIKTDEEEAKFYEAAALADRGEDIPEGLIPKVEDETTKPEGKPDIEDKPGSDKTDDRPRDAMGRFTKTKDGKDIPEAEREPSEQKKPDKQVSPFEAKKLEQQKKDAERLDKTWENVNRQKDELAARERALQQQEQASRQRPQQRQVQNQQREFSSQDLWRAAQDFKVRAKQALEASDFDGFNENNALAEQAEQHARQFYQIEQREVQQTQIEQYNHVWTGHMNKAIEGDPDLIKPETPIAKEIHSLLESHGQVFYMIPDGFAKAVEIARLRLDANSASELRTANETLQKEVERLNAQLGLGGGGVTQQPAKKKFEDMNEQEQDEFIAAGAAKADSGQ